MNHKHNSQQKETAFYCSSVYHLVHLTRASQSVYEVGISLTKGDEKSKFYASAKQLADYLGYSEKQIRRGRDELTKLGFFELVRRRDFDTTVYRVLTHKQWADENPGQCAEKTTMPWEGEGDPLGRKLFAASAGGKTLREHQTFLLRKTEIHEDIIIEEFRTFLTRWKPTGKQDRRYWFDRFYDTLKWRTSSVRDIDRVVFRVYQETGHVFPHSWHHALSAMLTKDKLTVKEIVERYREHVCNKGTMQKFCIDSEVTRMLDTRAKAQAGVTIQ